jgi:hypothetical protein
LKEGILIKEVEIGKKYNMLTVIKEIRKGKHNHKHYVCKCDCGETVEVHYGLIGKNKSCGCYKVGNVKHGKSKTRIYSIWVSMLKRCEKPKTNGYEYYGGRGIKVCDRWHDFMNFYEDMNPTYKDELQLDRINSNGHYEPDNCRWITVKEQHSNKRSNHYLEYRGKMYTKKQLSEIGNMSYETFNSRLGYGWSVEKAVETPIRKW